MILVSRRTANVWIALILVAILLPSLVLAAGLPTQIVPTDCNGAGGCKSICDIFTLANNIINAGIFFAVFICAVLFAWAGFKYMTAQGNSGQAANARKIFTRVAVGLVIILIAWLVVNALMTVLVNSAAGGWNAC